MVGSLQLDVLVQRVESEYGIKVALEAAPCTTARWLEAAEPQKLKDFAEGQRSSLAEDRDGSPVFLARNDWELNYTKEKWPDIDFVAVS